VREIHDLAALILQFAAVEGHGLNGRAEAAKPQLFSVEPKIVRTEVVKSQSFSAQPTTHP
jgi:hypothetical protein